jgi:N-acetylglucosaminyldiphosphoundecaprenol N-acetyl-beta-D-mannosaminyltransferase
VSKQQEFDKLGLLGVDVDATGGAEAIDYICRQAQPGRPACYVIKPYVEFLDRAYHNDELTTLLNRAELSVPDGVALTWAAAYLYAGKRSAGRFWLTLFQIVLDPEALRWPLTSRAAGISFTWPLLEAAAARRLKVFLVGTPKHNSIGHTRAALEAAISGLNIVGAHDGHDPAKRHGEVSEAWLNQLTTTISAAQPDLVLVGMGFPLQEQVCAHLAAHLNHGVFIGEGGTFDYERFGGARPKAPAYIQNLGLEWLWRLVLEPWRLRRQLAIPRFIARVWRER